MCQQIQTNGVESFWTMMKREHRHVYCKPWSKHLRRYSAERTSRLNYRNANLILQMAGLALGMAGKPSIYWVLITDNVLKSGART